MASEFLTAARVGSLALAGLTALLSNSITGSDGHVTPVQGESWLNHLHRDFSFSSMGRTWSLGPPVLPPYERSGEWQLSLSRGFPQRTVTLTGEDIYRLNCRGCHQDTGLGAPPEINSILDPVRATSVSAVVQRMKNRGLDMPTSDATQLARQAKDALLDRLRKGGRDMPPFPYLTEAEIHSLMVYLRQLAHVPGSANEKPLRVESTLLHLGEQIVKSNCHICHDSAGVNPSPKQLLDGAIPPLTTLTTRKGMPEFVRKVTEGAAVLMGNPPEQCRGRMSVFYYFSQDEAASAYLYLSVYPPHI